MITRVAACGLYCLISACSITSPHQASTPWHHEAAADANTPVRTTSTMLGLASTSPQNYAPEVLFMKAHGDFMMAREPWKPEVQFSGLFLSDTEVKGEAGDFNLQHTRFDVERRIHMPHSDTFVDIGLQYGNRTYDFTGTPGAEDETLHRASMTLTYGQFVDRDTLVEVDFNPGIWSDFSDSTLHHHDWQFYARALLTWRYSKELYVMGGVEYSGLFRDFAAYPVFGVAYVIDQYWRFDMLLPRQLRLTYNESEHNSVFLSLDLDGGEYRIRGPLAVAPAPSRVSRRINVQEFEASIGAMHRFNMNVSVQGRVGMLVGGDYRFFGNNATADYDGTLEPQIFVEIGLGFSF